MAAHRRSPDLLASYGGHPSRAFQSEGWPATRSSRVASNSPPSLAPIYSRAMVGTLRVHSRAKGGLPPEALELRRTAHRRSPDLLASYGGHPSRAFQSEGWSGKRDSNPRLRPWQGRTLPLSYSRPNDQRTTRPGWLSSCDGVQKLSAIGSQLSALRARRE